MIGPARPPGPMPAGAPAAGSGAPPLPGDPLVLWLERLVFGHRRAVVAVAAVLTGVLGTVAAVRTRVGADFEGMMPSHHPFVETYRAHRGELHGLGEAVYVALESREGDAYRPAALEELRKVTDALLLAPGVDRAWVRSIWMPGVRWTEVTEEGYRGGPVMPEAYDGGPASLEALRRNVRRAGVEGTLISRDGRSALVFAPLLEGEGAPDALALAARLEELRREVEGPDGQRPFALHVVGFPRLVGDLVAGARQVLAWFGVAAAVIAALLLVATRCLRSTALVVGCSLTAVAWQLGLIGLAGLPLDPFSVLVPFLIFAMGVSHGTQKMNGVLQDVGRGLDRLTAARQTFRRLFLAGLTAILTDLTAFAALLLVEVPAVQRLAVVASLGAGVLLFTNLVLLPVLLSYAGVSPAAATRSVAGAGGGGAWRPLERLAGRAGATATLAATAGLLAATALLRPDLRVGDLERGAPELQPDARYNRDVAFLSEAFGLSADRFAVLVQTAPEGCLSHASLVESDRLAWALQQLPGVRGASGLPDAVRQITAAGFEGQPRWLTLSRDQAVLNFAAQQAVTRNRELFSVDGALMPVVAELEDHRSETLDRVVAAAAAFAREHDEPGRRFLLAAGSAGLEAASQAAVRQARWPMTLAAFGAVILLALLALRSWRAVVVTILPLAATTALCEGLMAWMGVGIKLSTLPVIALGVGIPDFALYLLAAQLPHQRAGLPLKEAWGRSLRFTGRAVVLVSLILSAGVVTWAFSPIRLQAEMGRLLTFMFLGNLVAALTLLPALSWLLLDGLGRGGAAAPDGAGEVAR